VNTFNLQLPTNIEIVTHLKDCIDYFLYQNFNVAEHFTLPELLEHKAILVSLDIKFLLFERN